MIQEALFIKHKENCIVTTVTNCTIYHDTVQGKAVRGQDTVTTLAPFQLVNAVLPVVKVQVDGVQCSALVDTGCSQSIVSVNHC